MGHCSLIRYPWSIESDANLIEGRSDLDFLTNTRLNQYFIEVSGVCKERIQVDFIHEDSGLIFKRDAHFYAAKAADTAIYTLPCVLMAGSIKNSYKLNENAKTGAGERREKFKIRFKDSELGFIVLPVINNADDFSYIDDWLTFFDYIIERNTEYNSFAKNIVRFVYLKDIIHSFCGNDDNPVRSKILEIMENLSQTIVSLEHKLRKNLTRTRRMMPVERINELDAKCLTSLLKIKGRSIKEKARSSNMQLLGIAKVESYNMLENRVLKDFVYRCNIEIDRYLRDYSKYAKSRNMAFVSNTIKQLKIFKTNCLSIYNNANLAEVPRQISLPKPNFVLQQNIYYKKVWHYYLELINSKKDIQKTLLWQQNLFQDIADMLLNVAMTNIGTDPLGSGAFVNVISRSSTDISQELLGGSHRLKASCNAGPFILNKLGKLFSIEIISNASLLNSFDCYMDMQDLFDIGAPTYIVFSEISEDKEEKTKYALAVYTMHNIVNTDGGDEIKKYLANLRKAVVNNSSNYDILPWLIVSVDTYIENASHRVREVIQDDVYISQIELNPKSWIRAINSMEKTIWGFIRGQIDAQ